MTGLSFALLYLLAGGGTAALLWLWAWDYPRAAPGPPGRRRGLALLLLGALWPAVACSAALAVLAEWAFCDE